MQRMTWGEMADAAWQVEMKNKTAFNTQKLYIQKLHDNNQATPYRLDRYAAKCARNALITAQRHGFIPERYTIRKTSVDILKLRYVERFHEMLDLMQHPPPDSILVMPISPGQQV